MFKRYTRYIIIGFIALSVLYIASYHILAQAGLVVRKIPFLELYEYQVYKAQHTKAQILFIGDSALGNAIDAGYFSELSGTPAQNLALTGHFGFKGTLAMLKRARHKNLKTVIIMQTPDIFTRPIADDFEAPRRLFKTASFSGIDISIFNFLSLQNFFEALKKGRFEKSGQRAPLHIENDYVRQGGSLPSLRTAYAPIQPDGIVPHKEDGLAAIAGYCKAEGLDCLYVHGPVVEDICTHSDSYLRAANRLIDSTAMKRVPGAPLCIPRNRLGDAVDHVRPAYKQDYTKRYYTLLKPYL